jgi:hypothetical protein
MQTRHRVLLWLLLWVAGDVSAALVDGLLLYLPCDEGGGSNLQDESPTRAQTTLRGRVQWADGAPGFGRALDFRPDEEGHLLVLHDFGALSAMTLALRVYATQPAPARWDYLLDTRSADIREPEGAFYLGRNRDGELRLVDEVLAPDAYPRRTWFHLAVLADGGSTQFFVEGQRVAVGGAVARNIGDRLVIGNRFERTQAFAGMLDDIAIWGRLLNSGELRQVRARPLPTGRAVANGTTATLWAALKALRDLHAPGDVR